MTTPTVFVVDDDATVREGVQWLLESVELAAETYASAHDFLAAYDPGRPGCLVLDVRMPGLSGLEAQARLAARGGRLPVIVITGHADVPMAVRAMKAGAVDFLEKPFSDQVLLDAVQRALAADSECRKRRARRDGLRARLALLTVRERDVLDLVLAGASNKVIAARLDVSDRTVEAHRARVMEKTQAQTVAELARLVLEAESPPDACP